MIYYLFNIFFQWPQNVHVGSGSGIHLASLIRGHNSGLGSADPNKILTDPEHCYQVLSYHLWFGANTERVTKRKTYVLRGQMHRRLPWGSRWCSECRHLVGLRSRDETGNCFSVLHIRTESAVFSLGQ